MTQTDERTHHNGKSLTSRSKIAGLDIKNVLHIKHSGDHIVTTLVQNQLGGIHPCAQTKNLHDSRKESIGRFTSNVYADRLDMLAMTAALDPPTPMRCLIQKSQK